MCWSTMQVYTSPTSRAVLLSDWHQAVDTNFWGMSTQLALPPHFLEREVELSLI